MQEAKIASGRRSMCAGALQQIESAVHIGANEFARGSNRAVDMGLGGEMNDRARLLLLKYLRYERFVVDVAMDESKPRIRFQIDKILQHPSISKRIEDDNPR